MDKFRILVKGIVQCNGKYLVVEKWYDDRIFEPYQWEFLDGVLEFSETPEKAVQINLCIPGDLQWARCAASASLLNVHPRGKRSFLLRT